MLPHTYSGVIIAGSKKARDLGFPTANIPVAETVSGIYAGMVSIEGAEYVAALFGDEKRKLLEAYLIDFSGNLYGKQASFTLIKKIREHEDFTDNESLRTAITNDVKLVREYFKQSS